MLVARSENRTPKAASAAVADAVRSVSPQALREFVDMLSFSRHYFAEKDANLRARDLLYGLLRSYGYAPTLQGAYDNIVATTGTGPHVLLGAHYDSVPGTPGADDNASAVAACLECARLIKQHNIGSTMIVLFNREEDGLLGSSDTLDYDFLAQVTRLALARAAFPISAP